MLIPACAPRFPAALAAAASAAKPALRQPAGDHHQQPTDQRGHRQIAWPVHAQQQTAAHHPVAHTISSATVYNGGAATAALRPTAPRWRRTSYAPTGKRSRFQTASACAAGSAPGLILQLLAHQRAALFAMQRIEVFAVHAVVLLQPYHKRPRFLHPILDQRLDPCPITNAAESRIARPMAALSRKRRHHKTNRKG